jgi:hypothetical protein
MNNDIIYIGTEKIGITNSISLPKDDAFEIWSNKYAGHLKNLYKILQELCIDKKIFLNKQISLKEFSAFVYNNSSKFISYWE